MGANLLNIIVTLALQSPSPDTSLSTSPAGIAFERTSDLLQYNRVQGLSFGLGYRMPVPGSKSAMAYATVRYGISDERVTGRLSVLTGKPNLRVTLAVFQDIVDVDSVSPGRSISNSVNSLFAGHDNGDYAFSRGASVRLERSMRPRLALIVGAQVDGLSSVASVAHSEVNDFLGGSGIFPPNPPVEEGTFTTVVAQLRYVGVTRWVLTSDVLAGSGRLTARLFGDIQRAVGTGLGATLRLKTGVATSDGPPQSLFRLGGLNTVRGFEYGTVRAPAFWAGQIDVTAFKGKIRPVVFFDVGQAAAISDLLSSQALVAGGIGLSLFGGLARFDLSEALSPDSGGKVRFDIVIRGVR
jgi:hypothetical protein